MQLRHVPLCVIVSPLHSSLCNFYSNNEIFSMLSMLTWTKSTKEMLMSHYLFSFGNIWCLISEAEEKEHFVSSEGSSSPLGLLIDSSEASDLWFRCCQNFIQVLYKNILSTKSVLKSIKSPLISFIAWIFRIFRRIFLFLRLILFSGKFSSQNTRQC